MRVYMGCPHQPGTDRKCCTNLFQRKNGRPRLRKGNKRPNTPPLLLSISFFPEGWEGPCPQKEVMVRFGGQPNWLQTNFMIRKIFFGPMVLENILQVALLNKDSLLKSWLLTDQEQKKGSSFSICQYD